MLSPNAQIKWTHQKGMQCLLYSLMYPWIYCQVFQFEKPKLTRVSQHLVSVLAQHHFLLILSLFPPTVQLYTMLTVSPQLWVNILQRLLNFFLFLYYKSSQHVCLVLYYNLVCWVKLIFVKSSLGINIPQEAKEMFPCATLYNTTVV